MSIVPLKKVTLFGPSIEADSILSRLQDWGCLHVIDVNPTGSSSVEMERTSPLVEALAYLKSTPQHRSPPESIGEFRPTLIVDESLEIKRQEEELAERLELIEKSIETLKPWGQFARPTQGPLTSMEFVFLIVPLSQQGTLDELGEVTHEVSRDSRQIQVVVINPHDSDSLPGQQIELGDESLEEWERQRSEALDELSDLRYRKLGLTKWIPSLAKLRDQAIDEAQRLMAADRVRIEGAVFALQAWIPSERVQDLTSLKNETGIAYHIEEPEESDDPPTLLRNPPKFSASEALVTFYKTPRYDAWDPSLISLGSFAIFFAMIIADAGYGLLFGALTIFLWKRLGSQAEGKKLRTLLAIIVAATVIYGVLCGSYFGVSPGKTSLLGRLAVIDAQSQSLMMPLTIAIGVIHLSVANVAMAWSLRPRLTALAPIGWVLVMIGVSVAAFTLAPVENERTRQALWTSGSILAVAGLACVFLFSSARPIFDLGIKNQFLRAIEGLQGLTGVSGLFGDVLSYLRLFALGLSSAKLSETFNRLGASAWDAAGWGVIISIAIVVLGHALNLLLSIMGGVVHGLRLNCIEFFKWSLPEEGYSFRAFAKRAKES